MPGQKPVIAVIMLPLVIPGIILGVALLVVVNKIFQLDLSLFTVALGHVLISVPFAMATLIRVSKALTSRWKKRRPTWARTPGGRFGG